MLARAILIFARPLIRIAKSLEKICALYEQDCAERGIVLFKPGASDEVEVTYGPKAGENEWPSGNTQ